MIIIHHPPKIKKNQSINKNNNNIYLSMSIHHPFSSHYNQFHLITFIYIYIYILYTVILLLFLHSIIQEIIIHIHHLLKTRNILNMLVFLVQIHLNVVLNIQVLLRIDKIKMIDYETNKKKSRRRAKNHHLHPKLPKIYSNHHKNNPKYIHQHIHQHIHQNIHKE